MTSEQGNTARKGRKCGKQHLQSVERMFRDSSIIEQAERYVSGCLEHGQQLGDRALFPNLAGFGRAMGIGLGELKRLGGQYPAVYDAILAVLEDGALNAERIPGKSALLAMTYFRRRLGYEQPKAEVKQESAKEVRVIFDHDIEEDGK